MAKKLLPRGAADLMWQILLFCGAYWVYRLVRGEVWDQSAAAVKTFEAGGQPHYVGADLVSSIG